MLYIIGGNKIMKIKGENKENYNKQEKQIPGLLIILLCFTLSNITLNNLFAKKKINSSLYHRIGILVNRVGNEKVYSPMPRISLKTDYSVRKPTKSRNVYIDEEKRLLESIPNYPFYPGSTTSCILQYYKNITPEMTKGLIQFFIKKGFESIDFRVMAKDMNIPFLEMSIKSILTAISGKIDALFILQYMDIGTFLVRGKDIKSKNIGFGSISYSIAVFDVSKQKRLFFYSPLFPFSVTNNLIHDTHIMSDPETRAKIKIDCQNKGGIDYINVNHSFTENELIQHFIRILLNGFKCPSKPLTQYHKKIYCFSIKGLNSFIQ